MKKGEILALAIIFIIWGGGKASADELSTICNNGTQSQECKITTSYSDITNDSPFQTSKITLDTDANITTFTNNSTITSTSNENLIFFLNGNGSSQKGATISHFINNGTISGGIRINNNYANINSLTNYGEMRGIWSYSIYTITINNFGIIKTNEGQYFTSNGSEAAHFAFETSDGKLSIQNYKIKIIESVSEFNSFSGYSDKTTNKNSHLIITGQGTNVEFKDNNSKILLDFGDGFELGGAYQISKLITERSGSAINNLNLNFSHLALSDEVKDFYTLINSGDYFIIKLLENIEETPITAIYKSNIRTINNFMTMSNALIYQRKSQNLAQNSRTQTKMPQTRTPQTKTPQTPQNSRTRTLKRISQDFSPSIFASDEWQINDFLANSYADSYDNSYFADSNDNSYADSAILQNGTFFYKNYAQTNTTKRTINRNYSRKATESSTKPNAESSTNSNAESNANSNANSQNYYFIFAPFVNYNAFSKSGNYKLSGLDYGFFTAFNAKFAETNSTASTLGAHFAFSYGTLGDSFDKSLSIKSMDFMVGLHYKLDFIYDMFFKARGDVFYFLNTLDSTTLSDIKPNNLGFGVNVAFGKDFDFKQGGILGIELGVDYKGLNTNKIELYSAQTYKKALYHLIYVDLGLNYAKYFGGFGINIGGGFKANLAPKLAKSAIVLNSTNLDFTLETDKYLGYVNAGVGYLMQKQTFDMEFSLAYYGNFGDKAMSNGGGFEWRTRW